MRYAARRSGIYAVSSTSSRFPAPDEALSTKLLSFHVEQVTIRPLLEDHRAAAAATSVQRLAVMSPLIRAAALSVSSPPDCRETGRSGRLASRTPASSSTARIQSYRPNGQQLDAPREGLAASAASSYREVNNSAPPSASARTASRRKTDFRVSTRPGGAARGDSASAIGIAGEPPRCQYRSSERDQADTCRRHERLNQQAIKRSQVGSRPDPGRQD